MQYIIASNPDKLLDKAVDFVKSLSGVGEDVQLVFDLDYNPSMDTYVIKIKITKLPTVQEQFPELVPVLPKEETEEQTVDVMVPVNKVTEEKRGSLRVVSYYVSKDDITNDLKDIGYREYKIAGVNDKVPALSLISAVGKWIQANIKSMQDLPVKYAGKHYYAVAPLFYDLVKLSIEDNYSLTKKSGYVSVRGIDTGLDALEIISDDLVEGKRVEGYVEGISLENMLEKDASWDSSVVELLPSEDGVIDITDLKNIAEGDLDLSPNRDKGKHKVASAFISVLEQYVDDVNYDVNSGLLEMQFKNGADLVWGIDYDPQTDTVNLQGLNEAISKTLAVYTPFAEQDKPLWKVEQTEDGRYVLVPIDGGSPAN